MLLRTRLHRINFLVDFGDGFNQFGSTGMATLLRFWTVCDFVGCHIVDYYVVQNNIPCTVSELKLVFDLILNCFENFAVGLTKSPVTTVEILEEGFLSARSDFFVRFKIQLALKCFIITIQHLFIKVLA